MPAVEPAWHRRRQQQRSSARKLLKAVDALLEAPAEVPSHLVTEIPKAISYIQGHHGSEVPKRVLGWGQSMNEGWQTKSYGKKRHSWLWTPQSAEKYGWVARNRRGCKAWLSWDSFTNARCACGFRWGSDILETAYQRGCDIQGYIPKVTRAKGRSKGKGGKASPSKGKDGKGGKGGASGSKGDKAGGSKGSKGGGSKGGNGKPDPGNLGDGKGPNNRRLPWFKANASSTPDKGDSEGRGVVDNNLHHILQG